MLFVSLSRCIKQRQPLAMSACRTITECLLELYGTVLLTGAADWDTAGNALSLYLRSRSGAEPKGIASDEAGSLLKRSCVARIMLVEAVPIAYARTSTTPKAKLLLLRIVDDDTRIRYCEFKRAVVHERRRRRIRIGAVKERSTRHVIAFEPPTLHHWSIGNVR